MKQADRSVERLLAIIWDNKYEPDKIACIIESVVKMPANDLIKKNRMIIENKEARG